MKIEDVIKESFQNDYFLDTSHSCFNAQVISRPLKFINIPINDTNIEIPTIGIPILNTLLYKSKEEYDKIGNIVFPLSKKKGSIYYKTLTPNIYYVLRRSFYNGEVVKFMEGDNVYYGTTGTLLDKDFNPLMICTWKLNILEYTDTKVVVEYAEPIIRVNNTVFTKNTLKVHRFIMNKFIPEALKMRIAPYDSWNNRIERQYILKTPRVIIGNFPFKICTVEKPTINTNNEDLLKVAIDNIDDMYQICT